MAKPDPRDAKVNYFRGVVLPKAMDAATKAASLKAAIGPVLEKLATAVKTRDAPQARFQAERLRSLLGDAKPLINEVRDALDRIAEVEGISDEALGSDKSNIGEWKSDLMNYLIEIGVWATRAKTLLPAADRLVKASGLLLKEAIEGWAGNMRYVRAREKELRVLLDQVKREAERGTAALRTRERLALAAIQSSVGRLERTAGLPLGDDMAQRLKEHFAAYDPKEIPDAAFAAQVERDRKEIDRLATSGDAARTATLELLKKIRALKIEPPDAAKAIKVLGLKLTATQAAMLKNSFERDESVVLETLNYLAEESGAKMSGKNMLAKLKREKIL